MSKKTLNVPSFHQVMESHDDVIINPTAQESGLSSRRQFLKGGLGLLAVGIAGLTTAKTPWALPTAPAIIDGPFIGFSSIPVVTDPLFDEVIVPPGYIATPFFSWGDPVESDAVDWQPDASNSWQEQLKQAGDNHDGMHFFAFPDEPDRGLLVINHEYSNPTLHPEGMKIINNRRHPDDVKKEQAAHGLSVIEVCRSSDGGWHRVYPSAYNRRITTFTPMQLSGPVAGHKSVKTTADRDGKTVLGTLNNCANGFTPWGTYLACEENWHNYFVNHDETDYQQRVSHHRYGISTSPLAKNYGWNSVDPRFDATPAPDEAHLGYVNEPNRFGWVVEIDPFEPDSVPIKRTAFGRFSRECVAPALAENGQMAFYSGDDTRGEYIYKFVPSQRYDETAPQRNRHLLDDGVLYVARFDDNGQGEWLALQHGKNGLTPTNGFDDQQSVLVNARAAADKLGATPMDRPEWAAVNPHNRDVYVSLTNNHLRGSEFEINAANPRTDNRHGQIVTLREHDNDPAATAFKWELFVLAGEQENSASAPNLTGNIQGDIFSSPDGLGFDADGRLWILTDYDDDDPLMASMGCNQMLCADPVTREIKRFLVGPRGCEITGITWSPDHTTLWVNIQHPGISYPASDGQTRPRSTTVMIRKEDGGIVGT